ncbi:hypothetical protein [Demequina sp.]|uniref:hypothetical protein n=1 Tax=Demequina sp. TaxID=2050685 RepID=UPI0025BB4386|nr:hypothetical protein [Demequina sp.]
MREFLYLEDGTRVVLREGLEFTFGSPDGHVREGLCAATLMAAIRNVVLPEVSAADPERPWACMVQLARRRRVQTTADELAQIPYEVHLTDAVRRWL